MGFCDRIYHKIKLKKDAVPFRRTYSSMSFEKRKAMKKIVEDLKRDDLVEPLHSDWAAPSLLVPKKDGTYRLVVDYRGQNKQIEKTCWPLPRINEVIDSLEGNMYFSNIDLLSGYFQMALEEESQNVTVFITPLGLYKWKRLPMGLASAPGAFKNLMELIFAGLSYEVSLVYLDDVIVFGRNFEEHLKRLELVFQRLSEKRLKIKGSKCNFLQKRVRLFGHIISESGVEVDPEKVRAIEKMKEPTSLKDVRAFRGHFRKFIPDFGRTAETLYRLLNKANKFEWSTECTSAVAELKKKILEAPILGYLNDRDHYMLTTDASLTGIGAILTQKQGTEDRVIAYASKTLSKSQRNYSATERELFAIIRFTPYFKNYLPGQRFLNITDHRALVWIYSFKEPDGMVAIWIEKLWQFNFDLKHRAGKKIPHADRLSCRNTEDEDQTTFGKAIALDVGQDVTNYSSRGWQLPKLKRVKLQDLQQSDNILKEVYSRVINKKRPEPRQIRNGASKELWKHWVQYKKLFLIEGILYRKHRPEPNFETVYQMLVPGGRVSNVLQLLHDSPSAGHFGIENTYKRACERFYWPCPKRDVRNWIECCDVCLKRKGTKQKHRHSLTKWKPSHPFWLVSLDIMGPLPESQGDKKILLIGDQFSKWYEAVASPNQEAKLWQKRLLNTG